MLLICPAYRSTDHVSVGARVDQKQSDACVYMQLFILALKMEEEAATLGRGRMGTSLTLRVPWFRFLFHCRLLDPNVDASTAKRR